MQEHSVDITELASASALDHKEADLSCEVVVFVVDRVVGDLVVVGGLVVVVVDDDLVDFDAVLVVVVVVAYALLAIVTVTVVAGYLLEQYASAGG